MRTHFFATILALAALSRLAVAQSLEAPASASAAPVTNAKPAKSSRPPPTAQTLAQMQQSLDELSKSNHDLLDLLKQQQAVLQDIQYDRRLQSRQIDTLEERLEEALADKRRLQEEVDRLELQASTRNGASLPLTAAGPSTGAPANPSANSPVAAPTVETVRTPEASAPSDDATPPQPPGSGLPPEETDFPPGQLGWHRLVTLKGTDNQQTPVFTIHGKFWRVVWHNQDKPGKLYANTSALFISAYPRDDTIPEKVCAKLGTGADSTQLSGPGNFYLKIEASGGSWEAAVEDYH